MSILKEKLSEAMESRQKEDLLNSFVWKGQKTLDIHGKYVQNEKKMMDMSEGEMIVAYEHCKTMLYNQDPKSPGRYNVLVLINDQKNKLGAELFIRYASSKTGMSRFTLMESINSFLANNKEALKNYGTPTVTVMFSSVPDEFKNVTLDAVIDGCLDTLGTFNKKHITRTLILKQGIWLSHEELHELPEVDKAIDSYAKIQLLREILDIKEVEKLQINSKGLSFTQMRAMLNLKPNRKYSDMTTPQLETLRNKMLFVLENSVNNHITAWTKRMEEIELVADYKGYKL